MLEEVRGGGRRGRGDGGDEGKGMIMAENGNANFEAVDALPLALRLERENT